jgi:hypothetical protein
MKRIVLKCRVIFPKFIACHVGERTTVSETVYHQALYDFIRGPERNAVTNEVICQIGRS